VIIGNWNSNPAIRKDSLAHFAKQGNPQIIAGYYDGEPIEKIRDWMQDAAVHKGFSGVIYTTWVNKYDRLEAFAECVKAEWKKLIVNSEW